MKILFLERTSGSGIPQIFIILKESWKETEFYFLTCYSNNSICWKATCEFYFYFYFWPHLRHAEVPRPGKQPMPQKWPEPWQWQHWPLNPLSCQGTPLFKFYYIIFLLFYLYFGCTLPPIEIPGPGIESELQLPTMPQLQQCWILNPLCWTGDQTHTSAVTQADAETKLDP